MNQIEENHEDELSIFEPLSSHTSIHSREWIESRSINQSTEYPALEFLVPPQSAEYMDLKNSTLKVKIRLTDATDQPITTGDVGLVNLALHSIFSQVDCTLQQTPVGQTGTNYPYKAYIDTLLSTNENDKITLQSQLFVKDEGGRDDPAVDTGSNTGLYMRALYTKEGHILEIEGPIHLDIFQQNRLMINGVSLALKFWPSKNSFCLMSDTENASYKVQILDASFKLCVQKPNAGVLMAHSKMIRDTPAIYPYVNSSLKIASISKGQYSYSENNLFQSEIPTQLVVGMVASASYGGDYKRSPMFFQPFDCNFLGLYIDGQTYPSKPLQPNFAGNSSVEAYRTLSTFKKDIAVSLSEFNVHF